MNLRRVDLNLLVAFDALMQVRHVTRAAALVGIGQPGMSAALARLRHMFNDELLVKQGGEMVPTARALELAPEIRRILRDIDILVSEPPAFDSAVSRRTFTLRMSDLLSFLLLPAIIGRIGREAPGVALEIAHLDPVATVDALESNAVDLAISTNLKTTKSIHSAELFQDRVIVAARADHPARWRIQSMEGFTSLAQIRVAQSPIDDRFADRQLADLGQSRSVSVTVPHWLAVPEIVARSDLVAIVPLSIARRFGRDRTLELIDPPFRDTSFVWSMYWHRRQASDPAIAWLRSVVTDAARAITLADPGPSAPGTEAPRCEASS